MAKRRARRPRTHNRPFDPNDPTTVRHTRIGIWNLYEEIPPAFLALPRSLTTSLEPFFKVKQSLPYVWRMLNDISTVKHCWALLCMMLVLELVSALIPALDIWFGGQFLTIVESALDTRTVDKNLLIRITSGQFACSIVSFLLRYAKGRVSKKLHTRIRLFYATHNYHALSRLDVPTFCNDMVQQQLQNAISPDTRSSIAGQTITSTLRTCATVIELISKLSVLVAVLRRQQDGPLLAVLSFAKPMWTWMNARDMFYGAGVWAATTTNADYIKSQGLKRSITEPCHRQEIVAGHMWEYMLASYQESMYKLGDTAVDFFEALQDHSKFRLKLSSVLHYPLSELPRIIFTLRAVQYPSNVPLSLVSFNLITTTTSSFSNTLITMLNETGSIADNFDSVKRVYEAVNIENRVPDGKEPFPEDQSKLQHGVDIEFRHVSFSYGDKDTYALRDVSFKIFAGQLCVIIGRNGSGKSTILKLIARIYEPDEGQILIDGRDIRSLKLADLRASMSVLFQDYTHFPLSIKDNIGLGCPAHANDMDKIEEAARLGGAHEFITELPDGFDTYLERPVSDIFSNLPEGTKTLFGRSVDYTRLRGAGRMRVSTTLGTGLSGGQMQRIALSRTFMRSFDDERPVGLLLFDEPSASLDPVAEHDLFERLRNLRSNKTMIFSSHRFGNLTRHADMILYINDAEVVEHGTHEQLMKKVGGKYAEIWSIQAQAFVS